MTLPIFYVAKVNYYRICILNTIKFQAIYKSYFLVTGAAAAGVVGLLVVSL